MSYIGCIRQKGGEKVLLIDELRVSIWCGGMRTYWQSSLGLKDLLLLSNTVSNLHLTLMLQTFFSLRNPKFYIFCIYIILNVFHMLFFLNKPPIENTVRVLDVYFQLLIISDNWRKLKEHLSCDGLHGSARTRAIIDTVHPRPWILLWSHPVCIHDGVYPHQCLPASPPTLLWITLSILGVCPITH